MVKYSIIIPVKAINDYVRETVPYIQRLDSNEWELIILPNGLDRDEWADPRVSIIPSGRVGPAKKRDIGASYAVGEILVFLDDDSYPDSNLLKIAEPFFRSAEVVAIGGPAITPPSDGFWQKVSGAVFLSKYSGGNPERYISIGSVRAINDWPSVNFMVRKDAFISIGGFNSDFWPGEDTKLCLSLIEVTNKKILYIPELIVWHHRRSGLISHLKQVGAYGMHRGFFVKKYPKTSRKLKYFLPTFLFIYLFISIFLKTYPSWLQAVMLLGWCFYLIALLRAITDIVKYESILIALASIPYIFLTQIWYGIKFLEGISRRSLVSKLR